MFASAVEWVSTKPDRLVPGRARLRLRYEPSILTRGRVYEP